MSHTFRLVLLLVALVAIACTPPGAESDLSHADNGGGRDVESDSAPLIDLLDGTTWRLESIATETGLGTQLRPVSPWPPVTIYFEGGFMGGRTGCNDYGAPYTVGAANGLRALESFEMTESECTRPGEAEVELGLIAGLTAAESFALDGEMLTIAFPNGELEFRLMPEPGGITADVENAVYAAVLGEFYRPAVDRLVIRASSRFRLSGDGLDETMTTVKQLLTQFGGDLASMAPATEANYRERNTIPTQLTEILELDFPVTFMSEREYEALVLGGSGLDWEAFDRQFPNARGIVTLSLIGFDAAGEQALVYTGLESEDYSSDWYALMIRDGGLWRSTVSFALPAS